MRCRNTWNNPVKNQLGTFAASEWLKIRLTMKIQTFRRNLSLWGADRWGPRSKYRNLRTETVWYKRVRWWRLARSIKVPCAVKSMSWTADMFRSQWKAGCLVISHGAPKPTWFCAPPCCVSPRSHWEKPLHIHCTCWINGFWFRSLNGWIRVRPHSLHASFTTLLETFDATRQLFTGHFLHEIWSKDFCLQKLNKIERDKDSRMVGWQVLHAFKHLDTIHFQRCGLHTQFQWI